MSASPVSVSSQEEYMVEAITNKRVKNGRTEYEVKWQGYSENEKTWEPIENLQSVMTYVLDFEQSLKTKPQEVGEGSYEDGDSADEIIQIRKDNDGQNLLFQVSWKLKNSRAPKVSWINQNSLKMHNPEILIDYLLKKIKWPNNK
ncbi:unnamed protein product (macronuclear) [Paramecium tetraurelia]|uniref:Chromo domain-containing protein n=1 Tax=Paramecium tetraurelia TaxID=5888 RepID=A0C2P6_PARTE|nr:uncharacterized protein GSPATT00034541001 [Paramecium tetraurelia]CAK65063.1 unnamed protein product [Paramecium tetraurelia]|eukprot:XP_001432460.1 hypothetical protein (macronuclear) [Paramecium tetraurelia strain d4-2]